MGVDMKPICAGKVRQNSPKRRRPCVLTLLFQACDQMIWADCKNLAEKSQPRTRDTERYVLIGFGWAKNGMVSQGDWQGLNKFVSEIRASFATTILLIYNSQKKEKAELLPLLDSPRNTIRAIFSVNALNEGWDVLSLYDIIHFDISEAKRCRYRIYSWLVVGLGIFRMNYHARINLTLMTAGVHWTLRNAI